MKNNIIALLLLMSAALGTYAQQNNTLPPRTLTLEECLMTALASNYNIKIERGLSKIADNNVSAAPFLPTISATAGQTGTYNTLRESPRDGESIKSDYTNNQYSADLSLNWRLFDGLAMFATYDSKRELLKEGELNLKANIENLIADISDQYYYLITQQSRLEAAKQYLAISIMRYNQALEKYNIGSISGLEMKQAKIDLNADSSKLVLQQQVISNGYIQLFELMNAPLDTKASLTAEIEPNGNLLFSNLLSEAQVNNTSIQLSRSGQRLSTLDLKIARSNRYPTLDFGARYRFDRSSRDDSNLRFSNQYGPNFGFTLSAKLFDRTETTRKIRNAKIEVENSTYEVKQIELEVESNLAQMFNIYRKNFTMIGFESESAEAALANLDAAMDMYRLGTMSGIEFREIQRSYLEAVERKLDAIFQAKSSEIGLLLLSGQITK